jgi:hypothetical protein
MRKVGTRRAWARRRESRSNLSIAGKGVGGAGGIRTLDTALQPYNGLANRRLQPLGHSSIQNFSPERLRLKVREGRPFALDWSPAQGGFLRDKCRISAVLVPGVVKLLRRGKDSALSAPGCGRSITVMTGTTRPVLRLASQIGLRTGHQQVGASLCKSGISSTARAAMSSP